MEDWEAMGIVECFIPQKHHQVLEALRCKIFNYSSMLLSSCLIVKNLKMLKKVTMNEEAQVEGLETEFQTYFEAQSDELRKPVKQQILKTQCKIRKKYNLKRRGSKSHRVGDVVVIK
ncbi:hypothetical protein NPIL_341901 [Nephila pilipes]|uniref:Uncharacterized protein n=1 Tax=Nephila pilipes TaxID=299642 RepID=A0A8X6U643_NEPPI|nr:hypothetical protein NPIL_341901 [Nephila pilipes]